MFSTLYRQCLVEKHFVYNLFPLCKWSQCFASSLPELAVESTIQSVEEPANHTIKLEQRFIYPEFLPDPKIEWRNPIRERLERQDMLKRRSQIEIPEFYVGTIMAVTSFTPHSASKSNRFLGICIQRKGCGLRATFVLRNVVDNLGTEIAYHLYDPTIEKIEVIKLEKRMDDELFYLRDALPEYSTFPLDMEPVIHPENTPIPINTTQVILKPRPWVGRWERTEFKGINREHMMTLITDKMKMQILKHQTPWEKYDLMKQYRATIPEEEQKEIFAEVYSQLHQQELSKKKSKRIRTFVKPKKTA